MGRDKKKKNKPQKANKNAAKAAAGEMVLVGDTAIPRVTEDENTIHVNLPDYIISVPKEFPLTNEETNQLVEGMASALNETIQESLTKLGKKKIHLTDLNNNSLNPDACMSLKPENLKASVMGNGESNSMGLQGIPPDFEEYQRKILLEVFDKIQKNAKARLASAQNAENVQPKMAMIVAKKKDSKKSKKARDQKVAQPEKKATQPEKMMVTVEEKNVDHPEKKKSAIPTGNNNAAGDSSNKPQESTASMTSQEGAESKNDKSPQNPEVAAKPQEKPKYAPRPRPPTQPTIQVKRNDTEWTPQLIAELGEEKTILKTRAQKLVREAQLKLAELDECFDDVCTMREIEEHLRNIQQQIKIIRIENRDLMKFCIASSARFDLETDYPSELPPPPPPRPPPQATPPDESRMDSSTSYAPFIERSYSI